MKDEAPKFGNEKDLYLKGQGYVGNESINFDERISGQYHTTEGESRWQLSVFESGTTWLEGAGGDDLFGSGGGPINCEPRSVFVRGGGQNWSRNKWAKAVTSVSFKFEGCKDITKGRKVCDIKIAEKNLFCRKNLPLAFKSGVLDDEPKDGEAKDLYLKGQGYAGSESINFDEKYTLEDARVHGIVGATEHRWRMNVFRSMSVYISELSSVHGEGDDGRFECDKKPFEVTEWTYGHSDGSGSSWEKAVAKVEFKLSNCEVVGGRRKCDIEIAKREI